MALFNTIENLRRTSGPFLIIIGITSIVEDLERTNGNVTVETCATNYIIRQKRYTY